MSTEVQESLKALDSVVESHVIRGYPKTVEPIVDLLFTQIHFEPSPSQRQAAHESNEVRGIVFVFHGDEAVVIGTVRGADAVAAFVLHEVDIGSTARERSHRLPRLLRPTSLHFCLAWVRLSRREGESKQSSSITKRARPGAVRGRIGGASAALARCVRSSRPRRGRHA